MKKILNDIYYEQKSTNRQLQRLSNIVLIGILTYLSKNAKDKDDEQGKRLCKVGLILATVAEGILMLVDIMDYRSRKISKQLLETEDKIDM